MFLKDLKRWYALARPLKKYFVWQIVTMALVGIITFFEPIAFASMVDGATNQNSYLAFLWLFTSLGLVMGRRLLLFINYKNFIPLISSPYINLNERYVQTLNKLGASGLAEYTPEHLSNIQDNDIFELAIFADTLASFAGSAVNCLLIIFYVLRFNFVIGLILLASATVNYGFMQLIGQKKEKTNAEVLARKLKLSASLSEVKKYHKTKTSLSQSNYLAMSEANNYLYSLSKKVEQNSFKDNLVPLFWNIIFTLITGYLIFKLTDLSLSLKVFLIVVPYLNSFVDSSREVFDFVFDAKKVIGAQNRYLTFILSTKTNKKENFVHKIDKTAKTKKNKKGENLNDNKTNNQKL